jgi:hypothetical protein
MDASDKLQRIRYRGSGSNGCLDRAAAQGAGGVPEQPAVDARQVERVAAHRQAPRALAGLELLRRKDRQEKVMVDSV